MRKIITTFLAALFALPLAAQTVTNISFSGVSLITSVPATATAVSGAVKLPTFSGAGTLNITESGITGSPSGCSVTLKYQQNNATVATAAVVTQSFTPSTGVQQFAIVPSVASGDSYKATYACSVYPTAGLVSISFSPTAAPSTVIFSTTALDPCQNPNVAKSSVAISVSSATTTALVAASGSTKVYVCDMALSTVGTSPTAALEYGTGATCGTGTTAITGAMVASATVGFIRLGFGGSITATPASQAVCLVSGGTVTTETGVLTYVQQ